MRIHSYIRAGSFLILFSALTLMLLAVAGCGGDDTGTEAQTVHSRTTPTATAPAATTPAAPAGIVLDPNLTSSTGTPAPAEMKTLIDLQKQVPYPVLVPTELPGGCRLDTDLVSSATIAGDPTGYYSFRFSDPNNPSSRSLTFNQSRSNSQPLSGYYLTEEDVNGTTYQVYWHRTREYLPDGPPVRTTDVVKAETYVVTWKGQYTDAAGNQQNVYYGLTVGTWSGWGWSDIRNILASMKPLSEVGS